MLTRPFSAGSGCGCQFVAIQPPLKADAVNTQKKRYSDSLKAVKSSFQAHMEGGSPTSTTIGVYNGLYSLVGVEVVTRYSRHQSYHSPGCLGRDF